MIKGSTSYRTGNAPPPAAPKANDQFSNEFYPHISFLLFEQVNVEPILKKLKEIQLTLPSGQTPHSIQDPANLEIIDSLMKSSMGGGKFDDKVDILFQMIELWPTGLFDKSFKEHFQKFESNFVFFKTPCSL